MLNDFVEYSQFLKRKACLTRGEFVISAYLYLREEAQHTKLYRLQTNNRIDRRLKQPFTG